LRVAILTTIPSRPGFRAPRASVAGDSRDLVEDAIDQFGDEGPALGRPLADRVKGSRYHNMKGCGRRRPAVPRFGCCSLSTPGVRRSS
jgi:hypothetical protein